MEHSQKDSEQVNENQELAAENQQQDDTPSVVDEGNYDEDTTQTQSNNEPVKAKSGGAKMATLLSVLALGVGGTSMYMQVDPNANIPFLTKQAGNNAQAQVDSAAFDDKIASLDAKIASISETTNQAQLPDVSQLQSQIAQLQTQIEQVQNTPAAASNAPAGNVEQLQQQQQSLQEQVKSYESQSQQLQQTIDELKQQQSFLSGTVDAFSEQLPTAADAEIWQLRDVELLLKQANRNLQTVYDVPQVSALMQNALEQLMQMQRADLLSVSNTLKQEISALQSVEIPDRTKIVAQIDQLAVQANSLPLIGDQSDTQEAKAASANNADSAGDKLADAGAGFLKSLTDMIEIEKDGQAIRPIVSNELRELARQRTGLILETATAAYLSGNNDLFEARLQSAKQWVQTHFDQQAEVTKNWLQDANALSVSQEVQTLPDISASLSELSAAMQVGG